METLAAIFAILLLIGFCAAGPTPAVPKTGTCWAVGDPSYRTFDGHYYNFMGNCTYTMAKNCHVDRSHPAFQVEARNMEVDSSNLTMVAMVTINVYGNTITIRRLEFGLVHVNYQLWNLPVNLDNGRVRLSQSGLSFVLETDFGLRVQYDWLQYLVITAPTTFANRLCGMCGNFNSDQGDDLTTPTGALAKNSQDMGRSWRVPDLAEDAGCQDECVGRCEDCKASSIQQLEDQILCISLSKVMGQYFQGCLPLVDPHDFLVNCMMELCKGTKMKQYFCDTLQVYSDTCQRAGVAGQDWRTSNKCPPPTCRENSHYERCGSACPASCAEPDAPSKCKASCVETCTCDDSFLLSGNKCIPKSQCGCMYQGRFVAIGASFWGDKSCTLRYTCSAGGKLTSQATSCSEGKKCQVVKGIRDCNAVSYGTCMVSGDPHYVTFDGQHYNFQGTCAYEMAGVASNQTSLEQFSVILQNNGRDKKIGSAINLVKVEVYGNAIVINKERPGVVMINGELFNLPVTLDSGKLQLYTSGWFAVIITDFGVKVYYDWNSVAFVMVPSSYIGSMIGLCGNYNLNPKDDMQMKDGKQATTAEELGQSWKVARTPGCVDGCKGPCPGCNVSQRQMYNSSKYCGLIADPSGPFRECHSVVDPAGFLNDCLFDVCLNQGRSRTQCKTLTAYTAACQLKGAPVHLWRTPQFCDAQCPANGHYELCTTGCQTSCQKQFASAHCGAQCMEGCVCSDGYVLSGGECVPLAQCGCQYEGKYYKNGQVFYPDALCQQECTCNGTVQCKVFSCGANERCEVKASVRSCQPVGIGICSISGDPHYNTFDNHTYDFQGTCTYTAAKACDLKGSKLKPFSVVVENEKWYALSADPKVSVAKLVAVEVYGSTLILRKNQVGMVMVNGVLSHIPLKFHGGAVLVYQNGPHNVILTDFGLRVTYDMIYHVTITVPGNYWGHTCGLCGNFNGNKADEFQLPDGQVTKDLGAFGMAWKMSVPGVVCEDGCSGDLCPKCKASQKEIFEKDCRIITDPEGPFAVCHDTIDPASYYRDCVYDICITVGDRNMLCSSIAAYMMDCQDFGVKVQNWRTASFCPLGCPANSHYETCAKACDDPCPGLLDDVVCQESCAEGCACNSGFYFNGTQCVSLDQCSCYYDGRTYGVGESIMSDDCHMVHTCLASGLVVSQKMMCKSAESCQVQNGKMGCYPKKCYLSNNGTLITFTGETAAIADPGAYEIIQECDPGPTTEWFRVIVKLEMCGTPAANTFAAVYVFFKEMMITISHKHDIWVNGKQMTERSFQHTNVSVMVSDYTVTVSNPYCLWLSLSPSNKIAVSVTDAVAERVCGACGGLKPAQQEMALGQTPLISFATLNIGQWEAPDFPHCDL